MASSVFGAPVTVAMLRKMPEYNGNNPISQLDRAIVALEKVNEQGKAVDARNFLEKLQTRFGQSGLGSTMCLIYNATGANMRFVVAYDWNGRLCESAYPMIVANGQWGVFLYGQYYNDDNNSKAGIVYSALNDEGTEKHWFMGFSSSGIGLYNKVYTEIREPGYYALKNNEETRCVLHKYLGCGKLVHQAIENGGYVSGSIGNTSKPVFEAIMTLPKAI